MLAHALWFTDSLPPFQLTFVTAPLSILAVGLAVAGAIVWRLIGARLPAPEWRVLRPLGRIGPYVPRLLAIHAGVALLAQASRSEYLVPALELPPTWWGIALGILEGVLGVWLISGWRVRPAAWLLVAAGPLGMLGYGVLPIIERADLLGIGLFLSLLPPDDAAPSGAVRLDVDRVRSAVLGMRTLVGVALIVLAYTEKLARPELTAEFLHSYPAFNVLRLVGLPISDLQFIQFAAGVEILFGLLLISGAASQSVVLVAGVPFNATLFFLGATELIGHLPIYGAMLALLVLGSRDDTSRACSWLPWFGEVGRRRRDAAVVADPVGAPAPGEEP